MAEETTIDTTDDTTTTTDDTTTSTTTQTVWPDQWRQQMAGDDAKALKQLERYESPAAIWKKARALEQRLSSGELRSALPKDANEEQVKAWRAENGIPEAPEKYDLTFPDGLVIGEEDKPAIDDFLKAAHKANYSPDQVKESVRWYYDFQERQTEVRAQADERIKQESEDALRGEWGQDYRGNLQRVHNLLDAAPGGLKEQLLNGRLADGTPIGSSPDALRWIVQVARELNPTGVIAPNAGGNVGQAIDDEIAKFEKMMGDRTSDYWKGPMADKNQARLRDLYASRERSKARAA